MEFFFCYFWMDQFFANYYFFFHCLVSAGNKFAQMIDYFQNMAPTLYTVHVHTYSKPYL